MHPVQFAERSLMVPQPPLNNIFVMQILVRAMFTVSFNFPILLAKKPGLQMNIFEIYYTIQPTFG